MGWQSVKCRAYAVVDGVEMEVVDLLVTYELNTIPRCVFTVPVGREVRSLGASNIHRKVNELSQLKSVSLFVQIQSLGQQFGGDQFPRGYQRIFQGYATGTGYQRAEGGARFVIQAKGWLVDLDYTSSLSATSHPQNPGQFTYQATTFSYGGGGAGSGTTGTCCWGPFGKDTILNRKGLEDFWDGGLKPILEEIAGTDTFVRERFAEKTNVNESNNDSALKALKRIKNAPDIPLTLKLKGADREIVADAILETLLTTTFESFANSTMWGKLVGEIAPLFMFSLVPRPDDALVVPFVPLLRQPYITIYADEYDTSDLDAELERTLQAVGILAGIRADMGYSLRMDAYNIGIGGWFQPDSLPDGMILLRNGPPWLSNPIMADRYTTDAVGAGNEPVSNALAPGKGKALSRKRPGQAAKEQKEIIDNYAQYVYAYEAIKGRQGQLSGKLRFDIAPGSMVKIECARERFIRNDELGQSRYAAVTRVTIGLNAEAQRAGTAFSLAHIRNEAENAENATSLEAPPLWENKFTGAPLLDAFRDQSKR